MIMRLRFFSTVITACLILAFSYNSWAAPCGCAFSTRSDSLIGQGGIEYLVQQQGNVSPFNAELRMGDLYDSRVAATSGFSGNEDSDMALAARLKAGWQAPLKGDFGLRLDYRGYMDFHQDYNELNLIDQSLSLEPQYKFGQFIFSLPLSFNSTLEDGKHNYNRISVSPTLAYLIPNTRQAVALYGIGAKIDDQKENEPVDLAEDGVTLGGGGAYLYFFGNKSRVRLSLDYQHTAYDAFVWQYASTSDFSAKRENDAIVAGLDILYQITDHFGLYFNYAFIHSNSNVDMYEYDRHLVEGGLAVNF
jgi:hypothetical protein